MPDIQPEYLLSYPLLLIVLVGSSGGARLGSALSPGLPGLGTRGDAHLRPALVVRDEDEPTGRPAPVLGKGSLPLDEEATEFPAEKGSLCKCRPCPKRLLSNKHGLWGTALKPSRFSECLK